MIPKRLEKGDTIGVIAPSDPITKKDLEFINKSILLMEQSGFKVQFGKNTFLNELGYSATPKKKAEDLNEMFQNPNIKAIFCCTGGFNSNSLLEYIDYASIQANPKILCGFSDSTSILNIIHEKTGLVTFHGPTFKSLTSWQTDYAYQQVISHFVKKNHTLGKTEEYQTIQEGKAVGQLVGGNLSLISRLILGVYSISMQDKILFIEDLGFESPPAMISNYLYFMKQNGVFSKIKGLWIGNYEHESCISIENIVLDVLGKKSGIPIIKSNNFGHIDKKMIIPIGTMAKIDTSLERKIELLEEDIQ